MASPSTPFDPILPPLRPGVVVLLSGGLDSAILTGLALDRGDPVHPLYVRQGFVWEAEEMAAVQRFLADLRSRANGLMRPLAVAQLGAPRSFSSRWALDESSAPPDDRSPDEAVYLPGRNLALLTQASILAISEGLARIEIGILNANPFPDSRPEFFRAFEESVFLAMQWRLRVEAPLAALDKTAALRLGAAYPLEHTLSCLRPRDGTHCGRCNKCAERALAFSRAGVEDKAPYALPPVRHR